MQWGMPTMLDCADLEANAALCRRLGLQFVEINMNLPMYQADALKQAGTLSDRYGIGFTIHLDENFAPADFNPLVSEAYFETMRRTLRAALEIGAPVVNMHLSRGIHFKLPDRVVYLFDRYCEEYLSRIRALRSLCEREIGGHGLRVCIENTNGYLDFQKEAVALMLESDVFALTWDIGHSYTAELDDAPFLMANRGKACAFPYPRRIEQALPSDAGRGRNGADKDAVAGEGLRRALRGGNENARSAGKICRVAA